MKTIKVDLSVSSMNELLQKINNLKENLKQVDVEIQNELADYTRTEIENNLSATQYKDGNEDVETFIRKQDDKTIVGMKGTQVLYDEFGTGTEGANSPHPLKGNYKLNGYNSSVIPNGTIRRNKSANSSASQHGIPQNGLYWTYKDKDGEKIYTQGIPAGKQVFNASLSLKNKKKQVVKQKVSDALSKL